MRPTRSSCSPPSAPYRRRSSRWALLGTSLAVLVLLAAGCGGDDGNGAAGSDSPGADNGVGNGDTTLRLALTGDMQIPDPDVFYEYEGNVVITSVYQGLLTYEPGSEEIVGELATDWTVSDDGLIYTFTLRDDAEFADGTPLTSEVVQRSFERRTAVAEGPAYMLDLVGSYETPDESTFVVNLTEPVSPFLDYLAAPYGPKAVNPNVIEAEETDGDLAVGYLSSASAGIGPYEIDDFLPGEQYTLRLNDAYYGNTPYFDRVEISIIPDRSTQRLLLEQGDLDIMNRGLGREALDSLDARDDITVAVFPAVVQGFWSTNPVNDGPFADDDVRAAMVTAIDRERIADEVYGDYGELSRQLIPASMLLPGTGVFDPPYDPSALSDAVAAADGPTDVDMAFLNDDTGTHQRLCELTQQMLADAGLNGTCRGVPIATFFDWAANPETGADLFFATVNPDAVHPDTWMRIFNITGGFVNPLGGGVPEADTLMDEGLVQIDRNRSYELYGEAADVLAETGDFIPIVDVPEIFTMRSDITGASFKLPNGGTLVIADLARAE